MKLHNDAAPIETSGVTESSSFSIAMNGKAFKVLSDTLYSNKIGSIVREISCNAYDAHIMANKREVPFEIHVPNAFEPWFAVKDFGVGLSPESIKSVFTVYFQSTKDQSNDAIGAFGLGAKTPFAYTDQFTVTSIVDGKKWIYSAYTTPTGIPDIALMDESSTAEGNGVEIRMSVKREDFRRFADEILTQLRFFKVKPTLLNSTATFVESTEPWTYESPEFKMRPGGYHEHFIVQGNVGYPLDMEQVNSSTVAQAYKDDLKFMQKLDRHVVEMHFPIGAIGVTASREGVEYDEKTVTNICEVIRKISTTYFADLQAKVKALHPWDAAVMLSKDGFSREYMPKLGLPAQFTPNGRNYTILCDISSILWTMQQQTIVLASGASSQHSVKHTYFEVIEKSDTIWNNRRTKVQVSRVGVQNPEAILFLVKDKSALSERKLQYYLNQHKNINVIYEITQLDATKSVKNFITELHGLTSDKIAVVYLSEIVLPEEQKKPTVRAEATKYYIYNTREGNSIRAWQAVKSSGLDDIKDTMYYLTHDGAYVNSNDLSDARTALNMLDLPFNKLIAISAKKEVLALDNPNLRTLDQLKKDAQVKIQKDKARLLKMARILTAYSDIRPKISELPHVGHILTQVPESDFATMVKVYTKLSEKARKAPESLDQIFRRLELIGVPRNAVMDSVTRRTKKIHATITKYPLLVTLSNYYARERVKAEDVVQYVKAIDALASKV